MPTIKNSNINKEENQDLNYGMQELWDSLWTKKKESSKKHSKWFETTFSQQEIENIRFKIWKEAHE